jgi:hypothetical protein
MLTFEEAVEELENGYEVTLETDDNYYTIGPADSFIGGEEQEGYISEVLGNIIYDSAEHIIVKSIQYLEQQGETVTILNP